MSTRTVRRDTRNRSSRHTQRRKEITSNDVKIQLKKFTELKDNFKRDFDLKTVYNGIKNGNESFEAFEKSPILKKMLKFIKQYNKQELSKLNKIKEEQELNIHDISNNINLSVVDKRKKLMKMKANYEDMVQQINDAITVQSPHKFEPYTFVYYYHETMTPYDGFKKKVEDIGDLQLLLEEEETEEGKKDLEKKIFNQYKILNNINLDREFINLLGTNTFETPTLYKWEIYNELIKVIINELKFLTSSRSTESISGKKTKKRQYRRKIIKSKNRKN